MGELILCNQMLAALPYYIEESSLNVYSLEELSYYVKQNTYLIGQDFMNEELCAWVEQELERKEAGEALRQIWKSGGTLSEFVIYLLSQSGYCDGNDLRSIEETLKELAHRSEAECRKFRADCYMEQKKYADAICEYQRLFQMEDGPGDHSVLIGNAWHNTGTAYACLFLFEEAVRCFQRAYMQNQNRASLQACLHAYLCAFDEGGFFRAVEENRLNEEERLRICEQLEQAGERESIHKFEEKLTKLFETEGHDGTEEWEAESLRILEEWKNEYRKGCKI